jgi:pSer/pThr/pTyr-binding forkhead associated (FHA) protein
MLLEGAAAVSAKGHVFPITRQSTVIGRDETKCQILLPDDNVSNVPATLYLGYEGFELHDLDSRNGTFVNEQCINDIALRHGDEIQMGSIRMKFFDQ